MDDGKLKSSIIQKRVSLLNLAVSYTIRRKRAPLFVSEQPYCLDLQVKGLNKVWRRTMRDYPICRVLVIFFCFPGGPKDYGYKTGTDCK